MPLRISSYKVSENVIVQDYARRTPTRHGRCNDNGELKGQIYLLSYVFIIVLLSVCSHAYKHVRIHGCLNLVLIVIKSSIF